MIKADEVRCHGCGALLARIDGDTLSLARGGLQAIFQGTFHASFVCYRPGCQRLSVHRHRADDGTTRGQ